MTSFLFSLTIQWLNTSGHSNFSDIDGRHDAIGLIPCRAQQQQFSDSLDTLYFRGVGRNTSRHVRIWLEQKEMIGRTDWYLVILSSKTYVFEDKLTTYLSV